MVAAEFSTVKGGLTQGGRERGLLRASHGGKPIAL